MKRGLLVCLFFSVVAQSSFSQITSLHRTEFPAGVGLVKTNVKVSPTTIGLSDIDKGASILRIKTGEQDYIVMKFKSIEGDKEYGVLLGPNSVDASITIEDLISLCDKDKDSFYSFKTKAAPKSIESVSKCIIRTNHSVRIAESGEFWKSKDGFSGPLGEEFMKPSNRIEETSVRVQEGKKNKEAHNNDYTAISDAVRAMETRMKSGTLVFLENQTEWRLSKDTLVRVLETLNQPL